MPADSAAEQLERILYILPAAARNHGVAIDDIAAALGVDAATVLRDVEHVAARAFYHPAGTVETFSIMHDGRTIEVHAPHDFNRPVRLNQREALALGLGLRSMAAEADAKRRTEILNLAERLEAQLAVPRPDTLRESVHHQSATWLHAEATIPLDVGPQSAAGAAGGGGNVDYEDLALAFDDDGFRGVIVDALELQRVCTIWYLKPGDVAPAYRSIAPYRLIHADGMWYVAAWDLDREGLRFFRMDRVLDARVEDEPAPPEPEGAVDALLVGGGPYSASDDIEVRVRYSPRVARWVAERTSAEPEQDGSVVLYHRVADARWIVRHVLQYGGEAVLEEPDVARQWVAAAASDVAAAGTRS